MDRYVPLPPLPARISRLNELAYDTWWSWNAVAREVFRDLDYPLWRFTDHNPVLLLHLMEQERLEHAAGDPEFLRLYDQAIAALDTVRAGAGTWWARRDTAGVPPIAYVCPEFALHQSLPLDTAALGVAAGDYVKEASDLGVPIVGIGLMYPRGYMHQRLSGEGWQQEAYEYLDWSDAPINPALCPDGSRCAFTLALASGDVRVHVWQVRAGRVTLYLLDTDVPENAAWDRQLSSASFAADPDTCVRRAVLLGAGAGRALDRLGIEPGVWHVHEAASAFVALDRVHARLLAGDTWDTALLGVQASMVFNTRERAPARGPQVPFAAAERHIVACWPGFAAHRAAVLALGELELDRGAFFDASAVAARTAAIVNAPPASGADAWTAVTGTATARVSVSPGVHLPSWVSREIAQLFESRLAEDWLEHQDEEPWWEASRAIPNEELWAARQRLRAYLVDFTRERARRRWVREQSSGARLVALGTLLDPATLTIGFASRFDSDVRAGIMFHDPPRLAAILTGARRPVQLVFAGRAHPGDETGKHHLQRVFRRALDPVFGGRIAFLEDYDLHAARLLVQGCDVWLSTPARNAAPSMAALKAAVNGVPHLGTPAGWAPEAWTGANGWIADGGHAADAGSQDAADARAIYRALEEEVVPAFYERDRAGVPTRWLGLVRAAIRTGVPRFCARRAVKASIDRLYLSAPVVRG